MLRDNDNGIADRFHGGVVAAGKHKNEVTVHHFTFVVIGQEVRLTAQRSSVLFDVVKGELDVLGSERRTVRPGMPLYNFEAKAHPVGFWHCDQRTGKEFLFGLFDRVAALIVAKHNGLPLALLQPLLLGGVKEFVAINTVLCFGKRTLHLHQTIGKGKRIYRGVN